VPTSSGYFSTAFGIYIQIQGVNLCIIHEPVHRFFFFLLIPLILASCRISRTSKYHPSNSTNPPVTSKPATGLEGYDENLFRYAILMGVEVEHLENKKLYQGIMEWWGTPYRFGGSDHQGVDCSYLTQTLISSAYGLNLPRISKDQWASSDRIRKQDLREGDLVFFQINGNISHVGIYLQNHRFVHASTSQGVMISNLDDGYWQEHFVGCGRPRTVSLPDTH